MNDLKPEMEIQKYDWTTRLGSRRVEDGNGVNLNTILIKLKCENTQNKMDYRTCAPNTVMLFSIQLTCPCQFNLIYASFTNSLKLDRDECFKIMSQNCADRAYMH